MRRNFKPLIKKEPVVKIQLPKPSLSNKITTVANLLLAGAAIYLGCQANILSKKSINLSEVSLQLARNDSLQNERDSTRQVQINRLESILNELRGQNNLSQSQLIFSERADSTSNLAIIIENKKDVIGLRQALSNAYALTQSRAFMDLTLFPELQPPYDVLQKVVDRMEAELENPILIKDGKLKKLWSNDFASVNNYLEFRRSMFMVIDGKKYSFPASILKTSCMKFYNEHIKYLTAVKDHFNERYAKFLSPNLLVGRGEELERLSDTATYFRVQQDN